MSEPTELEVSKLKEYQSRHDDEAYHATFDDLLEEKLMQLDPEWMRAMSKIYYESKMQRWCA